MNELEQEAFRRELYFRRVTEAEEGEGLVNIHDPRLCMGEDCVFHRPSQHSMRSWPKNVRHDRGGLVERLCPEHGIGHPDPDSVAFFVRQDPEWSTAHGCCSCHHPEKS